MAKVLDVRIESHVDEFTEEMKQKCEAFLESIGQTAASAAADIPNFPVKTSRMRNSINWATHEKHGTGREGGGSTPLMQPEELSVYIGTNVEYAPYHELGTSRGIPARHFIQYGAQSSWNDGLKTELENYLKNE
jgi:phage gpG-like protein